MPASARRSVNRIEVYCEPLSLWWTTSLSSRTPSLVRVQIACSMESRTMVVAVVAATRQPRIRRA